MNNKLRYKLLVSLFSVVLMNACATNSSAMNNPQQSLDWLDNANPQADAMAALDKNDFRFMAMALRGIVIPGVEPEKSLQYELRCGVRLIEGVSDAVRSEAQLKMMQKAHNYAAQYNAIIKTRCYP